MSYTLPKSGVYGIKLMQSLCISAKDDGRRMVMCNAGVFTPQNTYNQQSPKGFEYVLRTYWYASNSPMMALMNQVPEKISTHILPLCVVGMPLPTAEWQQICAVAQAKQWVASMRSAMKDMTHLHLTVRLVLHNGDIPFRKLYSTVSDEKRHLHYQAGTCDMHLEGRLGQGDILHNLHTPALVQVSRSVFEILARAAPDLQHLSFLGLCKDGALHTFGVNCPKLHSCQIEASSVSPEALHDLCTHLPSLSHLKLMKRGAWGNRLQDFTTNAVEELGASSTLVSLELDFGDNVQIECDRQVWQSLPGSLMTFKSTSPMLGLREASRMLNSLQHLDVVRPPCDNLLELAGFLPRLKVLSLSGKAPLVLSSRHLYAADNKTLVANVNELEEYCSNLRISCPTFLVRSTCDGAIQMLDWIGGIAVCNKLTLHVSEPDDRNQLDLMLRMPDFFPAIVTLEMVDQGAIRNQNTPGPGWGETCLKLLKPCKSLKELFLHLPMHLTTSGMLALCLGSPRLETVRFVPCSGVDQQQLVKDLKLQKPSCHITSY